jgi:hypothetical protein
MYARGIGASRNGRPCFSSVMNQVGDLLFALFIPDDDLHDVFVEFRPRVFARHLEFVGASGVRVHYVELLIQLGSHQGFDLKPIWSSVCTAPRHALAITCAFFVFSETSDESLSLAENAI